MTPSPRKDLENDAVFTARVLEIEFSIIAAIEAAERQREELERLRRAIAALNKDIRKNR